MFINDKRTFYREKIHYAQDYDFYLNIISREKIIESLPEPLISVRIYPDTDRIDKKREKQILFSEKSKEFFRQRQIFGKDQYENSIPILYIPLNRVGCSRLMLEL